jgi:hypothetical protein
MFSRRMLAGDSRMLAGEKAITLSLVGFFSSAKKQQTVKQKTISACTESTYRIQNISLQKIIIHLVTQSLSYGIIFFSLFPTPPPPPPHTATLFFLVSFPSPALNFVLLFV